MGRMEKVNQQLKREIGRIIHQELSDPRLEFVSVSRVQASKDLKYARVYFSVLGDEQAVQSVLRGLEGARGLIRKYVAERMTMRYIPELTFTFDDSIEYGARLEETLKEIRDEQEKHHPDSEAA